VAAAAGGAAAVAAKAVKTRPLDLGPMEPPNPAIARRRASVSSILPASNRRHRSARPARRPAVRLHPWRRRRPGRLRHRRRHHRQPLNRLHRRRHLHRHPLRRRRHHRPQRPHLQRLRRPQGRRPMPAARANMWSGRRSQPMPFRGPVRTSVSGAPALRGQGFRNHSTQGFCVEWFG